MNCEKIQLDLPLYIDDVLSASARNAIESHLPTCPLCRQKLTEYGELRSCLRSLPKASAPPALSVAVRSALSGEMGQPSFLVISSNNVRFRDTLSHWLLPYVMGTVSAALFSVLLLNVLLTKPFSDDRTASGRLKGDEILLASNTNSPAAANESGFPRIEIPENSPEINPAGALVALTRSIVRGKMSDEEVVVVADVFGNGIANIAEIVDPPENARAMRELEKAFRTDPEEAPFLPTAISSDSDAVRVVLKFRRIDIER